MAGLATSFGSGAMTNSIGEMKDSACILLIGSNTTAAHPVISLELRKAALRGARIIVVNPMDISMVRYAHMWLRNTIGSDVALINGMARVILEEGLANTEFATTCCENFEAFKESLKDYPLDFVSEVTGLQKEVIAGAARLYATTRPASIVYTLGITEHSHGTENVMSLANLAMLTGNIGLPSTGVNPLRGQNNVQGACDMGCMPNTYHGYQNVANPDVRTKFENAWNTELRSEPGITLVEMFDAAAKKELKAMYLIGENSLLSEPDVHHMEEALSNLDFLVVQDIFLTETAQYADVVLPASSFAEKDGTFTNTERRVQRVRQVIDPVGESRPDWLITCQIAQKMGASGFDYTHPSQIMDELASLAPSYGGISYPRLESCGLQWPCPTQDHPGTPILHMSRFACGLGKFVPIKYRPPAEWADEEYPYILSTGRSLYHYHTGTMTRKITGLNTIEPEDTTKINPQDAEKLGIADGEMIKVTSRRGEKVSRAKVTGKVPAGVIYMDFHFAESPTNVLTSSALDPISKTPELKVSAVKIEKASN